MLYECVECGHKISEEAWRCPNCGSKDAGSYAKEIHDRVQLLMWEREKDRNDPGWREREAAEESKARAFANKNGNWVTFWVFYYVYLLPFLTTILGAYYYSITSGIPMNWQLWLMAIPVFNWLMMAIAVLVNNENLPALYLLIVLAIIGALAASITKPIKAQVN